MIHRLPFSNLVIEPAPEVMPGNIESKPYSIQSFSYWSGDTEYKTQPDRNWGIENDEDYKANKEQGEDIFLKFVPRGPYADGIYVGVVRAGAPVYADTYEYSQPYAYQIGVGDCDIKHRPWTDIEVSFDINLIETTETYTWNGDEWDLVSSTSSVFSSSSDSVTITSAMFDITPSISYMPEDLDGGGKYAVWYVEGYGEVDVEWQSGEQFYNATLGKIRTFWSKTEDIGELFQYGYEDPEVELILVRYTPEIDKITSITPASAFEPPTPA